MQRPLPDRLIGDLKQARGFDRGFVRLAVLAHYGYCAILQAQRNFARI